MTKPLLHIGHSPDPDDAFMWWPLTTDGGRIDTGRFRFEAVLADIEVLNERSETGELAITAMSCAQYPRVRDRYAITACGASMGAAYGPRVVARPGISLDDLGAGRATIAVPGERTTAFGALSLMLGPGAFRHAVVPFDAIIAEVAAGRFDAGLVIHEGQLTFQTAGLQQLADLGAWWDEAHGLPLPLGINTIRRDLDDRFGPGTLRSVTGVLRSSVEYALAHRDESLTHAMRCARDMGADLAGTFVDLYVNAWTLDFGPDGRRAVRAFLDALADAKLTPPSGPVDFVAAADDARAPAS